MTKPTKWLCVQRRLRSVWADLSLRWAHTHFVCFCHVAAHLYCFRFVIVVWARAWQNQQYDLCIQWLLRLAWASPSLISFHCLHEKALGPWLPLERTAKTLIRLGGCPGWSESSLGAHILLVLSCFSSLVWFQVCHANPSERARFIRCIYNLLNSSSPAVRYEAAGTLVTLSSAPTAIKVGNYLEFHSYLIRAGPRSSVGCTFS